MTDLLDSLADAEPDYDEPAPDLDGGTAYALMTADRHLRHIARIEALIGEAAAIYQDQLDRINEWHERQTQRLQRQREWHLLPLRALHAAILGDDPRRKTIELPNGTLKSRTYSTPKLAIVDDVAVMEWMLAHHPDALEPKKPGVRLVEKYCAFLPTSDGFSIVDVDTLAPIPGLSAWVPAPTFDVDTSREF